jgi:hypothetical protein
MVFATLERDCVVFNRPKAGLLALRRVRARAIASLRMRRATLSLSMQVPETKTDVRNIRTHIAVGN